MRSFFLLFCTIVQSSDYGTMSIEIRNSTRSTSSKYGSLTAPFVIRTVVDFIHDDDRSSIALCNHAFNEADTLRIDASFQRILNSLPTDGLRNKLMRTSVFRKSAMNKSQLLENEMIIESLKQCQFKFIRALDSQQRPLIVFTLTPNIPSLFKNKSPLSMTIALLFNQSGSLSPNSYFDMNDFIQLLEHDKVFTSFENNTNEQEWMHVSDQIAQQQFLNKIHFLIKHGGASALFFIQFIYYSMNTPTHSSIYFDLSVLFGASMSWSVAMCVPIVLTILTTSNPWILFLIFTLSAYAFMRITISYYPIMATNCPLANGLLSAASFSVYWHAFIEYLEKRSNF